MYPLAFVLFSIVANLVSCRPNGAPPVSCESMTPGHFDGFIPISRQQGKSPYILNALWDDKLNMVRLSVSGKTLEGFLIQGRLSEDGPAVGGFINITDDPNAKYQDCRNKMFASESSLTHTSADDKNNLVFFWAPPRNLTNKENVTFYATLAQTKKVYWVKQESNSVTLDVKATTKPTPAAQATTNATSIKNTTKAKPTQATTTASTQATTTASTQATTTASTQATTTASTQATTTASTQATTSNATTSNATTEATTPTNKVTTTNRGSNAASVGVSLLSILLIITIQASFC